MRRACMYAEETPSGLVEGEGIFSTTELATYNIYPMYRVRVLAGLTLVWALNPSLRPAVSGKHLRHISASLAPSDRQIRVVVGSVTIYPHGYEPGPLKAAGREPPWNTHLPRGKHGVFHLSVRAAKRFHHSSCVAFQGQEHMLTVQINPHQDHHPSQ